jgi:hypothetical protein
VQWLRGRSSMVASTARGMAPHRAPSVTDARRAAHRYPSICAAVGGEPERAYGSVRSVRSHRCPAAH